MGRVWLGVGDGLSLIAASWSWSLFVFPSALTF